jgi:hypothetical protein
VGADWGGSDVCTQPDPRHRVDWVEGGVVLVQKLGWLIVECSIENLLGFADGTSRSNVQKKSALMRILKKGVAALFPARYKRYVCTACRMPSTAWILPISSHR